MQAILSFTMLLDDFVPPELKIYYTFLLCNALKLILLNLSGKQFYFSIFLDIHTVSLSEIPKLNPRLVYTKSSLSTASSLKLKEKRKKLWSSKKEVFVRTYYYIYLCFNIVLLK